jgi:tetratricopeptide (TPR) repeat protein
MVHDNGDASFTIHGLVQAVERHQVTEAIRPQLVARAVKLLMSWAPLNAHRYENWTPWNTLTPHARLLCQHQPGDQAAVADAALRGEFGNYLSFAHGFYQEAEPLLLQSLAARERLLRSDTGNGAEHPDTLGSVDNLAGLYASQGRYGEAEPLYQRALEGLRRRLGDAHPNTGIVAANHARCLDKLRSGGS